MEEDHEDAHRFVSSSSLLPPFDRSLLRPSFLLPQMFTSLFLPISPPSLPPPLQATSRVSPISRTTPLRSSPSSELSFRFPSKLATNSSERMECRFVPSLLVLPPRFLEANRHLFPTGRLLLHPRQDSSHRRRSCFARENRRGIHRSTSPEASNRDQGSHQERPERHRSTRCHRR